MGHVACKGEIRSTHRSLVGQLTGERPPGRPRCGYEVNIKMEGNRVGGVDWIYLALSLFFPGMQQNHFP
jgi:hypothetical protein